MLPRRKVLRDRHLMRLQVLVPVFTQVGREPASELRQAVIWIEVCPLGSSLVRIVMQVFFDPVHVIASGPEMVAKAPSNADIWGRRFGEMNPLELFHEAKAPRFGKDAPVAHGKDVHLIEKEE